MPLESAANSKTCLEFQFLTLRRMGLQAGEVTARVLPKDRETAQNFLGSVMKAGDIQEVESALRRTSPDGRQMLWLQMLVAEGKAAPDGVSTVFRINIGDLEEPSAPYAAAMGRF